MKLCMSHYIRKRSCTAKFEANSSLSFRDMTSQNFPRKKGTSHQIRLFTPGKLFNFQKISFYVQNRSSRPKIDPPPPNVNFSKFQAEENFSFSKFSGRLDEKRATAAPLIDQFC